MEPSEKGKEAVLKEAIKEVKKMEVKKEEEKVELNVKEGFVKKTEEKQPDVYGHFDFNTFRFKVAGWKRQSEKGTNYLSVAVQFDKEESMKNDDFNETKEKIDKNISDKELDDEIPF